MIQHPAFDVEPWTLREAQIDLDVIAQSESLFTLANGHIGWRGNLDEGEPHGLQGAYLNGVFELRPLPYAEAGYGYPEQDQVVVNVTDAKVIRLLVDDEPLDIRYGDLHSHTRELDFRTGLLKRDLDWSTPTGRRVKVSSTRLVSFTQRAIAAIKYEVEAVDAVRVVVQSELVANEAPPRPAGFDPREAAALENVWTSLEHASGETWAVLVHSTNYSNLIVAAGMDHLVNGPSGTTVSSIATEDVARVMITSALKPGEKLTVVKFVGYGWSGVRTKEALRDQVDAALEVARAGGWNELCKEQREYLDNFWKGADVEIDGDEEIQQAVRFALFHVLQAGARNEQRAIPAKGLTGNGYDGHAFWDTESFVLSVLNFTAPDAVAHALRWRYSTLDTARDRAELLGFRGAAFPWRTIGGAECSSYWPAGTAAFHVSADVANAVVAHLHVTGDEKFEHDTGAEILIETSRLWLSLGHFDLDGGFRIDGVTGPDEYSAIADNNIYTNLMVQRSLRVAADAAERHQDVANRPRGQRRGDRPVASRGRRDDDSLRRGSRRTRPVRGFHSARAVELRRDEGGSVSTAPALSLLRPVSQAGRQAGGFGLCDVPARGRLQRRAEEGQLRLLRALDGARLIALGVHPIRDGRRSGIPLARLRLRGGGRAPRYPGPGAQHARWTPHGVTGRHLDRPDLGLRGLAPVGEFA